MTVLTMDRVLVNGKTLPQCWFPRTVELFDEERHRLETGRTGAAYHRSTDRGRENGAVVLVSEHAIRRGHVRRSIAARSRSGREYYHLGATCAVFMRR
ncbi:hypothetical protein EVAR_61274_1 [Eumeta japonica]|uniref:Uncharacterized protein n=1 Tax=Eumeta variegata TaxID=151549 RepID=A0A4C1Z7M6_EUMVA|nr:hypothetical protein EVAR_61274_1 [Eumeta japonica]